MQKIANAKDIKTGTSLNFNYNGIKGILVKISDNKIVAYDTTCPHEGKEVTWDPTINKLLCECHLTMFNVDDGSVYKFSSLFDKMGRLTRIKLKIDDKKDIYAE